MRSLALEPSTGNGYVMGTRIVEPMDNIIPQGVTCVALTSVALSPNSAFALESVIYCRRLKEVTLSASGLREVKTTGASVFPSGLRLNA